MYSPDMQELVDKTLLQDQITKFLEEEEELEEEIFYSSPFTKDFKVV